MYLSYGVETVFQYLITPHSTYSAKPVNSDTLWCRHYVTGYPKKAPRYTRIQHLSAVKGTLGATHQLIFQLVVVDRIAYVRFFVVRKEQRTA